MSSVSHTVLVMASERSVCLVYDIRKGVPAPYAGQSGLFLLPHWLDTENQKRKTKVRRAKDFRSLLPIGVRGTVKSKEARGYPLSCLSYHGWTRGERGVLP